MFYWKRCSCGEESSYTERITTMCGDIKLYYCEKCYQTKREREHALMEEREKQREKEQLEAQKQARYEYLKREVELAELEKKAKELGIE